MLIELYDFGIETRILHILLGVVLGVVFGSAAQVSRFCLRRAVVGDAHERNAAAGVWLSALAIAILAVQGLSLTGFIAMTDHFWLTGDLPLAALMLGGLAFGAGMVLTRGCASRLTILGASGNLRALTVLIIFAVTAHAMFKGALSPLRSWIGSLSVPTPINALTELPGGPAFWAACVALPLLVLAARSGAHRGHLILGGLIGLVAATGWAGTSVLLMDAFDPLPTQSIAFTLPWTETLFWTIASTAIPASFGIGFLAGVFAGAFASAFLRREFQLQSFESPAQTLRYGAGGLLMGIGGALAGGCTVGAGLAGGALLSIAALIVLLAILAGAAATNSFLSQPSWRVNGVSA